MSSDFAVSHCAFVLAVAFAAFCSAVVVGGLPPLSFSTRAVCCASQRPTCWNICGGTPLPDEAAQRCCSTRSGRQASSAGYTPPATAEVGHVGYREPRPPSSMISNLINQESTPAEAEISAVVERQAAVRLGRLLQVRHLGVQEDTVIRWSPTVAAAPACTGEQAASSAHAPSRGAEHGGPAASLSEQTLARHRRSLQLSPGGRPPVPPGRTRWLRHRIGRGLPRGRPVPRGAPDGFAIVSGARSPEGTTPYPRWTTGEVYDSDASTERTTSAHQASNSASRSGSPPNPPREAPDFGTGTSMVRTAGLSSVLGYSR